MVKKLSMAILIVVFLCSGCSKEAQKLIVKVANEEGDFYDSFEITGQDKVETVNQILLNTNWEEKNTDPDGMLKYSFHFDFMDPNIEAKSSYYLVYLGSNNQITLVQNDEELSGLSIEDSGKMMDIFSSE